MLHYIMLYYIMLYYIVSYYIIFILIFILYMYVYIYIYIPMLYHVDKAIGRAGPAAPRAWGLATHMYVWYTMI